MAEVLFGQGAIVIKKHQNGSVHPSYETRCAPVFR